MPPIGVVAAAWGAEEEEEAAAAPSGTIALPRSPRWARRDGGTAGAGVTAAAGALFAPWEEATAAGAAAIGADAGAWKSVERVRRRRRCIAEALGERKIGGTRRLMPS